MQGPEWVGEEAAALVQERRGQQAQGSRRQQGPGARRGSILLCRGSSACDPGLVLNLSVNISSFVQWGASALPGYCVD